MVRTPGPGGMRTQRSGEMTPRRAACARANREVCVGKRSVTWGAIRAPAAGIPMKIWAAHAGARRGHADEDRARPGADRAGRLLAQRGVRLVADDDRVGVGDLPRVADEP